MPLYVLAAFLTLPPLLTGLVFLTRWFLKPARAPDGLAPLPLPFAVWAFLAESAATAMVLVTGLFRQLPSFSPVAAPPRGIAVLLSDAYLGGGVFWLLQRRLRRVGWESVIGIDRFVPTRVESAVSQLDRCLGELQGRAAVLAVIGHGTGGLLAREYLQRGAVRQIARLVTLGTPHQGTEAPMYRLTGFGCLQPVSPAGLSPEGVPEQCEVIVIYSDFDAWIVPSQAAYYPSAFNIQVRGVGHFSMLTSRRIFELIAENLNAGCPDQERRR